MNRISTGDDFPSHTLIDSRHLPADLMAGLVTFVVALPLCFGIALASSAPPPPASSPASWEAWSWAGSATRE